MRFEYMITSQDMAIQLSILAEYIHCCPSNVLAAQVVDVLLENLLKIKAYNHFTIYLILTALADSKHRDWF